MNIEDLIVCALQYLYKGDGIEVSDIVMAVSLPLFIVSGCFIAQIAAFYLEIDCMIGLGHWR